MPVDDFQHFVKSAAGFAGDAVVLGLTGHVDDENPLWATTRRGRPRSCAWRRGRGSHVTAGLYWLPATEACGADGRASTVCATISNGWSTKHRPVYGVVLPLVFDIDRARDVEAAEEAGFRRLALRTPAHECGQDLLWRLARAGALAWAHR